MTMTLPEIEHCLKQLRLSGVRATLETRILQAQSSNQAFLETFSLILQDELDRRRSRLIERRYQHSGLDEKLTLADFDWGFNPKIPKQACFELHTLKFIAGGEKGEKRGSARYGPECGGVGFRGRALHPLGFLRPDPGGRPGSDQLVALGKRPGLRGEGQT